jgi:hypothetical protein
MDWSCTQDSGCRQRYVLLGYLSVALGDVGAAYQASACDSTTLLTLLLTANALIGASAKELWVLYQLVPLFGICPVCYPLEIVSCPTRSASMQVWRTSRTLGCQVQIQSRDSRSADQIVPKTWTDHAEIVPQQIVEHSAHQIYARAMDPRGSAKTWKVILGILGLVSCMLLICGACIMLSTGSIIV